MKRARSKGQRVEKEQAKSRGQGVQDRGHKADIRDHRSEQRAESREQRTDRAERRYQSSRTARVEVTIKVVVIAFGFLVVVERVKVVALATISNRAIIARFSPT